VLLGRPSVVRADASAMAGLSELVEAEAPVNPVSAPAWLAVLSERTVPDSGHDRAMTTYSGTKEFEGATFDKASFKGATLRSCDVSGVTMRSVDVDGLDVDSHDLFIGSLFVNGVDVVPLVDAELNRQFPGRELQKAQTPEGLREAWVAVQSAWRTTVAGTPPGLVDAHIEDEWSLAQTLRHLILATDAWLRGGILRMQQPFHEIGQIFTGAGEMGFDMSIFRVDPPVYEEILTVRAERQRLVTDFLATSTAELLAEEREDPWGGDWRPSVGDCIRVILEEEWAHLRYIRRDLARMR
jgi:hypothetical protein